MIRARGGWAAPSCQGHTGASATSTAPAQANQAAGDLMLVLGGTAASSTMTSSDATIISAATAASATSGVGACYRFAVDGTTTVTLTNGTWARLSTFAFRGGKRITGASYNTGTGTAVTFPAVNGRVLGAQFAALLWSETAGATLDVDGSGLVLLSSSTAGNSRFAFRSRLMMGSYPGGTATLGVSCEWWAAVVAVA